MKIFLFVIAGILGVVWFVNITSSHLGAGLQALVAFIGAVACIGLGGVVSLLEKMVPKPTT